MATRAFLLCGDEKAVQAVTQILDELEVSFEHSSEPAFSLKRLATQRFDVLIVDCDNVQNATQVFNSARASHLNKTSIAIAIVEGKAGVPNAFRLGASLVLTKPVALEQVRNTLRTGIGMTRKEAPDVKASVPAVPAVATPAVAAPAVTAPAITAPAVTAPSGSAPVVAPSPAVALPIASTSPAPIRTSPTPAVLTPVAPPLPVAPSLGETLKPASSPPAAVEKPAVVSRPVSVPAPPPPGPKPALGNFTDPKAEPVVGSQALAKAAAAAMGAAPVPARNFDSVFATPSVAQKSIAEKDGKSKSGATKVADDVATKSAGVTLRVVDPLAEEDALDPVKDHGVPSFGGLGKQSFAGLETPKRKGGKGRLVATLLLLSLAAGGYGAWATQPAFRKLVAWEYLNVMTRIAGLRGQPQTAAAQPLAPAPVPVVAAPTPPEAPAAASTDPNAVAGANQPATSATVTASTTTSSVPSSSAASGQPAASVPPNNAQKPAAVQSAKQDTTPNRAGANPALVPASLPPTKVAKAPGSDLLEVPEDYADDQVVHRVHPAYPKQASARKLHGTVVLQAIVNKQGKVDSLQLVSGDPLLAQAAAAAVKQWRYKPYWHNGEPADFQTRVTVDFKLP